MTSLYEITRNLESILHKIDEVEQAGETPSPELIDLLKSSIDVEGEKVDNCVLYIRHAESEIEVLKAHIRTIQGEIAKHEKSIERLKQVAHLTMELRGIPELKGKLGHRFFYRTSKSVDIFEPTLLPNEVLILKETTTADKALIKEMIEKGLDVPGAKITINKNLQVK